MSNDDARKRGSVPAIPGGESKPGSGEGANTALEALIRKRKQAENPADPEPPDALPPLPPAFPAAAAP